MKSVLLVSADNFSRGGVEAFLMNWIKRSDKLSIRYTWVIPGVVTDEEYSEEFRKLGVNVIVLGDSNSKLRQSVPLFKYLYLLCKRESFGILHVNSGGVFINAVALAASRLAGVKVRIAHSHSSGAARKSGVGKIVNLIFRTVINRCATKKAACSVLAAEALFGKKHAKDTIFIPNCIDAKRFAYSEENRNEVRDFYSLNDRFVVGQVARLSPEKNQRFIIEVFDYVHRKDPDARLMLVGDGPQLADLKRHVMELGLTNEVIFTGATSEPEKYLSAMDIFAFPSIFEGFGIAVLEAQASGLPCIAFDAVPPEVAVTELLRRLPLQDGCEKWAETILAAKSQLFADRKEYCLRVQEAGFDISSLMQIIEELYR